MKNILLLAVALMSMQAFGQRFEIGKATKSIQIRPSSTNFELALSIPVYKIEDRIVVETVSCRIPHCSSEQGDGSSGNWHNFFTVKAAEKPAALAAAIKGFGKATSEKVVEYDLFNFKPNSWVEFKALIRKIERQLAARGFKQTIYSNVVEVYGYENMMNLGYGNENTCGYVESTCSEVSVKEFKTFSHNIERDISVSVKNQTLQAFESDKVEITAGSEREDVSITTSGYNKYSATLFERGTVLELDATRIKKAFASNEVTISLAKGSADTMVMDLRIPAKFITEDIGSDIEVTFDICRADWFGGCFTVVGGPFKGTIKDNKMVKTFTTSGLRKGSLFFVRARLNKINSLFYSEAKSEMIQSNSVKN